MLGPAAGTVLRGEPAGKGSTIVAGSVCPNGGLERLRADPSKVHDSFRSIQPWSSSRVSDGLGYAAHGAA
jgi:hypothetical protein